MATVRRQRLRADFSYGGNCSWAGPEREKSPEAVMLVASALTHKSFPSPFTLRLSLFWMQWVMLEAVKG
jgi:hypothetical protein